MDDEATQAERCMASLARWIDDHRGDLIAVAVAVDGQDADVIAEAMVGGLLTLGDPE